MKKYLPPLYFSVFICHICVFQIIHLILNLGYKSIVSIFGVKYLKCDPFMKDKDF